VFHLGLPFINFGGRSAHLAYHVHQSGRKTSIIITIILMDGQEDWVQLMMMMMIIFDYAR